MDLPTHTADRWRSAAAALVSSTTTYKRPSTPRTNLIAAHDNVGSDRSQLANQGGYFNGEKIKTIVHHDDSRSQRIFWLSREALPATADLRHEHAMRTTRYSRVPYARPESRCRPLDCMKYTYEQEVLSECRFAP